ncbi:serine hydrolase domain-containing protein [Chryseobacterium echinoideorum]|uniref:serine hydrolase domain-containing protein n=1 Tax=Chryseobacterium echinoideorum TaxID=1549648 RepID=UPI0011865D0B|nr:serine hydrolase domain-containing protein [Chryseobacterium echinoideorum]
MIRALIATLFILALTCCKSGKQSIQEENLLQKDSLTNEIKAVSKTDVFNGFTVSIVNDKGTLYQKGFGFSDIKNQKKYTDATIQNIASISKTFVGLALLKAQELGKLKLDDPINKYLPFKVVNPNFPDVEITIRHLATHTSSIVDNDFYLSKNYFLKENQDLKGRHLVFDETQIFNPKDSIVSMEVFLNNLLTEKGKWNTKEIYTKNKPGEMYEYSNTATTLAAFVIEKATGEMFDKFTTKHILKPLKMNASGWHFEDVDFANYSNLYENPKTVLPFYSMVSYPDGNFITSVNDLSLYLTELIKGYNGKGSILTKESFKEYFKPQLQAKNFIERNDKNPYSESYNVGIFIGFGYTGFIGHTGGDPGVGSMMFFDPKNNIGRILIVNTSFSDKKGNDTFYGIWDKLEKYQTKLIN